jgi:hypothetical protein
MKNTFQLLTDTINHLQKLADDLGDLNTFKDAAQPELTRDTGKFVPEETRRFYNIDRNKAVNSIIYDYPKQMEIINFYNAFPSEEAAETEASYTLASRRVRAFAKAVNGDWKADFRDEDKEKFGVCIDENVIAIDSGYYRNDFIHQIAFPTEELAAKALELFRPEWEILSNP